MKKGIFSFFTKKSDPIVLLKEAVKLNPNGFKMILLNRPSLWTICRSGGDIHLEKHLDLCYHGDKSINKAIMELVEELRTPVSDEELLSAGSFESRTRHILAKTDPGQHISIGTKDNPVIVILDYKWGYWDDGVHVCLVDGNSTSRFGGKTEVCISWPEMYGYVHSLPPGKDEGEGWIRPRIVYD